MSHKLDPNFDKNDMNPLANELCEECGEPCEFDTDLCDLCQGSEDSQYL